MVGVFRRQQLLRSAIHRLSVEVAEVRIAARFLADALVVHSARRFVDAQQLRDVAFAACQLALLLSGLQVVQVQLAPVVLLRKPDRFIRPWQDAPVDATVAGFEERLGLFLEHLADLAGGGIRHAKVFLLVIARGRDEPHLRAVGCPLHVRPIDAALHVVTERGAMLVLAHLEARDFGTDDVDDHALDHRDVLIPGQRVLPRAQRRVPRNRVDEIHFAGLALILLEGSDLLRVRRPLHDRAIAAGPAGIVGGIAIVLDAVGRELTVLAGRHVAHPQVPVLDVDGVLAVRRDVAVGDARGTIAAGALLAVDVTRPSLAVVVEREARQVGAEGDLLERQSRRIDRATHGGGQR